MVQHFRPHKIDASNQMAQDVRSKVHKLMAHKQTKLIMHMN